MEEGAPLRGCDGGWGEYGIDLQKGATRCSAWIRKAQEPNLGALERWATVSEPKACALRGPRRCAPGRAGFSRFPKSAHTDVEGPRRTPSQHTHTYVWMSGGKKP